MAIIPVMAAIPRHSNRINIIKVKRRQFINQTALFWLSSSFPSSQVKSVFQLRRAQRSLRVNTDLTVSNHEPDPVLPTRPNRMFLLSIGRWLVQPKSSHQGQSSVKLGESYFKTQFKPKVDPICTSSETIQSNLNRQRHHYPLVSTIFCHVQSPQWRW